MLALTLLPLLSAGCTDEPSIDESKRNATDPMANLTIELAIPAGLGLADSWQLILDEWSAQTGAKVHLREYDAGDYDSDLKELLVDTETRRRLPTIFVVPVPRIAELAAKGAVSVIPPDQQLPENLNWNDVFEGLRNSAASAGRQDYFVPVSSPVLVCYYRRDLLDRAGLKPPATWDEYQHLLDTLAQWAPGMAAVEPWGDEYRATLFLARAVAFAKHPANISFCFDIKTGEPLIENPGFVRALETSRAAFKKMPQEVLTYRPADCRRELLAGRAAIGIAFETGPGNPPLPFGPETPNPSSPAGERHGGVAVKPAEVSPLELECVRLPGSKQVYNTSIGEWDSPRDGINSASLTGFGGLAIGVASRGSQAQMSAAWNLVGTLTLSQLDVAFPGPTKSVCRESQVPDGPRWLGDEIRPGTAQSYIGAVEKSLQDPGLTTELPVISRRDFRNALAEELGAYLSSENARPAAEVLAQLASRWRETSKQLGQANVHESYLRALGFPGPQRDDSGDE